MHAGRGSAQSPIFWAIALVASLTLAACGSDTKTADKDSSTPAADTGGGEDGGVVVDDGATPTPDGPPPAASCGNGALDNGEHCDGAELNGLTCQALGYTGGDLKCAADCKLDEAGCQGTPSGRQFGQTCSDTIGDCADPLLCVMPQGADVGFCTANCDTQACPSVPKGADCIFQLGDGQKVCGFLCDSTVCPPGLYCVEGDGAKYCTSEAQPICGDGKVEGAEDCDGAALNGKDCQALGYDGGTLKCGGSCGFDTSGCTGTPTGGKFGDLCGDTIGECLPGLQCVIASVTGQKTGFCTQACDDSKPCPTSPPNAACAFKLTDGSTICGVLCDPNTPGCPTGMSCNELGSGYACTTDPPPVCGDNSIGIGEDCDGTDLNNMSCASFGYGGGTLKCTNCKFDQSACSGQSSCNPPPLHCTAGTAACSKLSLMPASGDGFVRGHPADWSWGRKDQQMIYMYAASQVACLLPGSLPVHTFDLSDKYGQTPMYDYQSGQICFQESTTCQMRHPPGTHVAGMDLDSSYFQTSGMADPGPVCPHTVNGQEAYHCTGSPLPPTGVLDAPRTAMMLGKLFESGRMRVIGVDGQIGDLLKAEAQKLAQQGLLTSSAVNNFVKVAYEKTGQQMGWFLHHHHHFHASFLNTAYPSPMMPDDPGGEALPWAAAAANDYLLLDQKLSRSLIHPATGISGDDSTVPLVDFHPYSDKPDHLITLKRWQAPIRMQLR